MRPPSNVRVTNTRAHELAETFDVSSRFHENVKLTKQGIFLVYNKAEPLIMVIALSRVQFGL